MTSNVPIAAGVSPAETSAGGTAASPENWDLVINLLTGPEIVTGSTRLKAGTATKVALNIISTGVMARLGRVHGNLMIDLQPTNKKLRERAIGLVSQLAGCSRDSARSRLERAEWNRLKTGNRNWNGFVHGRAEHFLSIGRTAATARRHWAFVIEIVADSIRIEHLRGNELPANVAKTVTQSEFEADIDSETVRER